LPAFGRNPTSQVLHTEGESFLIDCGEGTQLQMSKYKVKRSRISHVFISHLHGDHYFGLPGLLTSMGLLQRNAPLHVYGPALLEDIIRLQLKASHTELPYPLYFHALDDDKVIADTSHASVSCFRVKHGIDCWGFLFRQKKKPRTVLPHKAGSYGIPVSYYESLQLGKDYIHPKGTIIPNAEVTTANSPAVSYAYSADTLFDVSIAEKVKGVDLLYHETTYLQADEEKAAARNHSTTEQAARIASLAGVSKLLIGHFSSKYESVEPFLREARSIFENTDLALEGVTYPVR
jgi:ribonuclease Z